MKILLVDDEYLIRSKLNKYLKESPFEINIIYEVSNGIEALNVIRDKFIDIAIVDIQMPLLTGIEFTKKLREESYNTKIIFLTGYEKFEYAKQAIKYRVVEYLLKPVKKDELYTSIQKCISLINLEQKSFISLKELEEKEKYQFLTDLLCGYCDSTTWPLNVQNNKLLAVSLEISRPSYMDCLYRYLDSNLKTYDVIYGLSKTNKIILIDSLSVDFTKDLFKTLIKEKLLTYCYFVNGTHNMLTIKNIFLECISLFPSRIFFEKYSIFCIDDFKYKTFVLPDNLRLHFDLLNKSEGEESILSKLHSYIIEINKYKDIYALKLLLTSFITSLQNTSLNEDTCLTTINTDYIINNLLYSNDTLYDIELYCYNYYRSTLDSKKCTISHSTKTILKVKEYLDENYTCENISLEFLSNKFYINSCHLSSTFKKVTGERLIEYITKKRIEKAKYLLKKDNIKMIEICEKIGYKDYYYFSKIFKKHVGISPTKYKYYI